MDDRVHVLTLSFRTMRFPEQRDLCPGRWLNDTKTYP